MQRVIRCVVCMSRRCQSNVTREIEMPLLAAPPLTVVSVLKFCGPHPLVAVAPKLRRNYRRQEEHADWTGRGPFAPLAAVAVWPGGAAVSAHACIRTCSVDVVGKSVRSRALMGRCT